VAFLGVAVLVLFVDGRRQTGRVTPTSRATPASPRPHPKEALALLRLPDFRRLVTAGVLLTVVTVGDGFVYLRLSDRSTLATHWFPLLAVASAAVYLLFAIPLGRLADRFGRVRVLVAGYLTFLFLDLLLLLPHGSGPVLIASLVLLGLFYAATDGVLAAAASSLLPENYRTSGLALLQTLIALGQVCASVLFGALWTWKGVERALQFSTAAMALAVVFSLLLLRKRTVS
jgi:MFS family permease